MPMSELTSRALLFAIEHHHGHVRKATAEPYIVHPVRVARRATAAGLELGLDGDRLRRIEAAALLHDTVEDTPATIEDIAAAFGDDVAAIVAELTQDATLPKPERRRRMVEKAGGMSFEARLIKLADRLDNVRDLGVFDRAFIERYIAEAEALVAAMRGTSAPLEEAILAVCARWRAPGALPDAGPADAESAPAAAG